MSALAIEGGGVSVLSAIGWLCAAKHNGELDSLRAVAGSSSGAWLAALLCVGWTPGDIFLELMRTTITGSPGDLESLILEHSYHSLSWARCVWLLARQHALNSGDRFYEWVGGLIKQRTGSPNTTFLEAVRKTGISCIIPATCFSRRKMVAFSDTVTPDVPLRSAVRASCAYPLFMLPAIIDGFYYYDAGITCNYPVRLVRELHPSLSVTGLRYDPPDGLLSSPPPRTLTDTVVGLLRICIQRVTYLESELCGSDSVRTVFLPTPVATGVVPSRNITTSDIRSASNAGYRSYCARSSSKND